jgi:hypothetical protein
MIVIQEKYPLFSLIKNFCRGVQGGQFFQKAPPLAAGGKNIFKFDIFF